jgi:hypothetical protein
MNLGIWFDLRLTDACTNSSTNACANQGVFAFGGFADDAIDLRNLIAGLRDGWLFAQHGHILFSAGTEFAFDGFAGFQLEDELFANGYGFAAPQSSVMARCCTNASGVCPNKQRTSAA